MKITEIIEESVIVLKTNRMRTGLSVLGIIIGIGSVIALMTMGQASQQSVKERIQSLGSNLLTIRPGSQQENGFLRGSSNEGISLKLDDAVAIEESKRITTIDKVAAEYSSQSYISYERNNMRVSISGVTPNYFELRNIEITYGSAIADQDLENLNTVVIVGPGIVSELFGEGVNPLGQSIKIEGVSFTVIGVTKAKGSTGRMNMDETVYIPLTTAQKAIFGVNYVSNIYVSAKSEEVMDAAQNQLGFFLLEQHSLKNPEDADFSISSQEDILATVTEITKTFTTLLTGIAAISLIVGGIGIMNIMLVTVTERTREIGIRKALGAKRKTIITQFLIESIVLTISGGIIGVVLGIGVSFIITRLMNLPNVLSIPSIALAVTVSCLIGVIFGWYPAQKASRLQPIDALRYE